MPELTGKQIYDQMKANAKGGESIGAAIDAIEQKIRPSLQGAQGRLRDIETRLAGSWKGQAAEDAIRAAEPLWKTMDGTVDTLTKHALSLRDQGQQYQVNSNQLKPMEHGEPTGDDGQPLERGFWDKMTPWDTDTEDKINQYNSTANHNKEIFKQYKNCSDMNSAGLPGSYENAPNAGAPVEVGNPGRSGGIDGPTPSGPTPGGGHSGGSGSGGSGPTPSGPGSGTGHGSGGGSGSTVDPGSGSAGGSGGSGSGSGPSPNPGSLPSEQSPLGSSPQSGAVPDVPAPGSFSPDTSGSVGAHGGSGGAAMPLGALGAVGGIGGAAGGSGSGRGASGLGGRGGFGSGGAGGRGEGPVSGAKSGAGAGEAGAANAARAAGGSAGARGGGMAGAPMGARGGKESDKEHQTASYLVNEDNGNEIVGDLPPTAPPVIGE